MVKKLYMQVTKDKYELPIAVAASVPELSRMCGKSENNISSQISKREKLGMHSEFVRVFIDDEVE